MKKPFQKWRAKLLVFGLGLQGIADAARMRRFLFALPWLVLVVGLMATYALWRNARHDAALALEAEFQFWVS